MSSPVRALLGLHNIPATFTREHDVILLAELFSLTGPTPWTQAHHDRLAEAIRRRFLRSASEIGSEELACALERSGTPVLSYRLTPSPLGDTPVRQQTGLLLTCVPNAHLALAAFLERHAVFTVETIGRVTLRAQAAPLH